MSYKKIYLVFIYLIMYKYIDYLYVFLSFKSKLILKKESTIYYLILTVAFCISRHVAKISGGFFERIKFLTIPRPNPLLQPVIKIDRILM